MIKNLTLNKSNCQNCYKCISYCPVKAIRFSGNKAQIIENECILCGQWYVVCPQNAKKIVDETEKVKVMIMSGEPVVVSLAPSFIANYDGVGIEAMREALKQLGFYDVEETAIGATMVKREYERMLREDDKDVVITSSCHSINLLIQKYFPASLKYLADVQSPMQAHCSDIKKRIPGAKTVFIGPCVAKKDEASHYQGIVDAVLTFEDLTHWLERENIELKREIKPEPNSRARFFPTTGGILKTMEPNLNGYTYMATDSVKDCMVALRDIESGKIHKCFIEMSACEGSCIGGPVMEKYHQYPIRDYMAVADFAGENDFDVPQPDSIELKKPFFAIDLESQMPSEAEIMAAMRQMGKFKAADELDCGFCGYNTCREKAIAICQGKAESSMCLPFIKDKAERFSDIIVKNTPSGFIVLNEDLEVQRINRLARKIMNIRTESDVLGEPVVRILDPSVFVSVKNSGRAVHNKKTYLAEYGKFVEQTVVYDKDSRLLIGIMRDITEEESEREKKESINRQTVEVADKVVEKQMRIVQEIASLLGETAAETKIALTKLKESISDE